MIEADLCNILDEKLYVNLLGKSDKDDDTKNKNENDKKKKRKSLYLGC